MLVVPPSPPTRVASTRTLWGVAAPAGVAPFESGVATTVPLLPWTVNSTWTL
jgi:hypothetical protein